MAFKLSPPVEKVFQLELTDEKYDTEGTVVTIKQASQSQHENRQDLFAIMNSKFGTDGAMELTQRFNAPELHRIEVRLTVIGCNIEDEDGKPLFRFREDKHGHSQLAMSEKEFDEAWGKLPIDIATEIHDKVLIMNPDWGPGGE